MRRKSPVSAKGRYGGFFLRLSEMTDQYEIQRYCYNRQEGCYKYAFGCGFGIKVVVGCKYQGSICHRHDKLYKKDVADKWIADKKTQQRIAHDGEYYQLYK